MERSVQRVVNDCGAKDNVLLLNQLLVLFTGMAGRLGFNGGTGRTFRNRFFDFGHSGYFVANGRPDDSFMQHYWVPLLLTNDEPELVDLRQGSALGGFWLTLLNNAEPIQLAVYTAPFIWLTFYINELRLEAERERDQALMTQSRFLADLANQATKVGDASTGALLALFALPDPQHKVSRPYVPEAEAALYWANQHPHEVAILSGHEGSVATATFSPDGRCVVTASEDKTARIWDAQTGKEIGSPLKHGGAVEEAVFSADANRVLTVSGFEALLWDAETGKKLMVFSHPSGKVGSAAFSPDGRRVVTASWDKTARIWDAETGKPIAGPLEHGKTVKSANFSPNGRRVVTASADWTARIWDAETGGPIGPPLRHNGEVESAMFSPDGSRVVTASGDKMARIWDAETGELLHELPDSEDLPNSGGWVYRALFSPDGGRVLTASSMRARLWDSTRAAYFMCLREANPELHLALMAGGCSPYLRTKPFLFGTPKPARRSAHS